MSYSTLRPDSANMTPLNMTNKTRLMSRIAAILGVTCGVLCCTGAHAAAAKYPTEPSACVSARNVLFSCTTSGPKYELCTRPITGAGRRPAELVVTLQGKESATQTREPIDDSSIHLSQEDSGAKSSAATLQFTAGKRRFELYFELSAIEGTHAEVHEYSLNSLKTISQHECSGTPAIDVDYLRSNYEARK